MLFVYALTYATLVAACAAAVEHPRRNRAHTKSSSAIRVSARPRVVYVYPETSVTIKCKAKGGASIEESPFISFYREFDFSGGKTVMPLSSGSPGVHIETDVPAKKGSGKKRRAVKNLTIGPDSFWTLHEGENLFYCKTFNMLGDSHTAMFRVIRVDDEYEHKRRENMRRRRSRKNRRRQLAAKERSSS